MFDLKKIRNDFPMLSTRVHGNDLVYLDNAASTHKPRAVIERMNHFYSSEYANIHRGVYLHSQKATEACDNARRQIQSFIGASDSAEIIFVRGATEAINLVAHSYGQNFLKKGDEVLVLETEHHANIVPWRRLCDELGLALKVIPVNDRGEVDMEAYQSLLRERTYLVAIAHVSNALGTVHPVEEMIRRAHHAGAVVLVDGAQSVPHLKIDVQKMDADFFVFSGHKMYGPTGIGVLYGKKKWLEKMPPYQGGGDMIESVSFDRITYAALPAKFEAGTPAIAEIIGLGEAVMYLNQVGLSAIHQHEQELLKRATQSLESVEGLRLIGQAKDKASLLSFVLKDIHPHDVGTVLDQHGVAVRAGHHCAQPTMKRFGVSATTRASFAFYNTFEEIDRLVQAIQETVRLFR